MRIAAVVMAMAVAVVSSAGEVTGEEVMSFKEAARRGPFGFADYVDLEKLRKLNKELADDDRLVAEMRAQHGEDPVNKIRDDGSSLFLPNSAGAAPAEVRESAHVRTATVAVDADVLVSASSRKSKGADAKAQDLDALKRAVREEVRSAVRDEVRGTVSRAMAQLAAKAKDMRDHPFGDFEPWKPREATTLVEDAGGCSSITEMDECFEKPICKWTINVGCAMKPCNEHTDFENCDADGSGCKWVVDSNDHDNDKCESLTPTEVATLTQQQAKIAAATKKTKAALKKNTENKEPEILKATKTLLDIADKADQGIMPSSKK